MSGFGGTALALAGAALLNVGAFASPVLAIAGIVCLAPVSVRAFRGLIHDSGKEASS